MSTGVHPALRYSLLVVFGPVFLAADMRSTPPFSGPRDAQAAALVGSLLYGVILVDWIVPVMLV